MTRVEIRLVLVTYVLVSAALAYLLLITFGYADADGYGLFIPNVGGYHISHLDK
jgi:hypothetical protein